MKLVARNLSCTRGTRVLFRDLSFKLGSGELLWVQGQNGAGKSTLLKVLAGLCSPCSGDVVCDAPLSFLGHQLGLRRVLTIQENINYHLNLAGVSTNKHKEDFLKKLQLNAYSDLPCSQLSAGQQRKVAFMIVALKQNPLWIVDEPFTALDKGSVGIVSKMMSAHLQEGGMIIMASHSEFEGNYHQVVDLSC